MSSAYHELAEKVRDTFAQFCGEPNGHLLDVEGMKKLVDVFPKLILAERKRHRDSVQAFKVNWKSVRDQNEKLKVDGDQLRQNGEALSRRADLLSRHALIVQGIIVDLFGVCRELHRELDAQPGVKVATVAAIDRRIEDIATRIDHASETLKGGIH